MRTMAEEALGLVLLDYLERDKSLPKPRAKGRNLIEIAVAPDVAGDQQKRTGAPHR